MSKNPLENSNRRSKAAFQHVDTNNVPQTTFFFLVSSILTSYLTSASHPVVELALVLVEAVASFSSRRFAPCWPAVY